MISHNYGKVKIVSCNSLPPEKTMTFQNVVILINKDKNNSYYNTFLERSFYELPKK